MTFENAKVEVAVNCVGADAEKLRGLAYGKQLLAHAHAQSATQVNTAIEMRAIQDSNGPIRRPRSREPIGG